MVTTVNNEDRTVYKAVVDEKRYGFCDVSRFTDPLNSDSKKGVDLVISRDVKLICTAFVGRSLTTSFKVSTSRFASTSSAPALLNRSAGAFRYSWSSVQVKNFVHDFPRAVYLEQGK